MTRPPLGFGPLFASILSGCLLSLAFPKPELWPLIFVGLAPLVLVSRGKGLRFAFSCGYVTGLTHMAILIYWVVSTLTGYGHMSLIEAFLVFLLLIGYLAVYPAFFALGLALAEQRLKLEAGRVGWALTGAALYTGLEYFKGFFLTGFPWEPPGAALSPSLLLVQLADVVGTGGLTFIVVLVNLFLAAAVIRVKKLGFLGLIPPAAAAVVIIGLMAGYGHFRLSSVRELMILSAQRKVAVIQGSIPQDIKWDAEHRISTMLTYRDLTLKAAAEKPWLLVWPETSAPFVFLRDKAATEWLDHLVRQAGRALLFGGPAFEEIGDQRHYYNRAYLLDDQAGIRGHYDKMHLVPFGEYVPLQKYLPFIKKLSAAGGDYHSGKNSRLLDLDGEKIGVLICFESVFPNLARDYVRRGAEYLAVITNDAWFSRSSAPAQHFSQAVLRAVETRRTVIRAANTGISGIIWPTGEVEVTLGLFKPGFVTGSACQMKTMTLYSAAGDLLPLISFGATLVVFAAGIIRRRNHVG
ncbi:MAG: apolipoprotein N-acyltransferase [Pseudomonadota bacterium]